MLEEHNKYRERHNVGPVSLNDTLTESAQDWANYLLRENKFKHSENHDVGENLDFSFASPPRPPNASATVGRWYNEIEDYDFNNPGWQPGTGHFTQVVWAASSQIGVGVASAGGINFVVAQYSPRGNILGQFEDNVLPPIANYINYRLMQT